MIVARSVREIRIAIVTEQRVFGESLGFALGSDERFSVDIVASDPSDAGLTSARIAVIVVDLEGLGRPVEDLVAQLRERAPRAGVIALSSRVNADALRRSIESGADGHVSKEKGLLELARAIVCVADGMSFMDAHVVVRSAVLTPAEPSIARLSPRERDVLRLLVEGRANRDIAEELKLGHKTVKNHVSNILSKLDTTSRTQAAIHALRSGIV